MTSDEDHTLVEATLAGDTDAFGELVDRYEKQLYNVTYRITGSLDDAMDATQTAFLSAYQKLEQFDPRYRFFSWLYRIAVNEAIDIVKGRREHSLPDPLPDPSAPGPERRYEAAEKALGVQEAILDLTENQRVVIVLRHYLGLTYKEMAEAIGIPAKTVKSRLYSARQRLQSLLLEAGIEPGIERR